MILFTQPIDADTLKTLGVPLDSADAYYFYTESDTDDTAKLVLLDEDSYINKEELMELGQLSFHIVPAWSLGQLIRIIKECGIGEWPKQDIMNTILKEPTSMMVPVAVLGITQLRAKNMIDFTRFGKEDI